MKISRTIILLLLTAFVASAGSCAPAVLLTENAEPIKLIWWQLGPIPQDYDLVMEQANQYLTQKLGVTLDVRYATSDYNERMSRVINSGESYDMAFTSSWTNPFITHAAEGAYADLSKVLPEHGKYLMESIPKALWDVVTINEKVYGVPVYKDSVFTPYFIFNQDDMNELGLSPEQFNTLEKLEPALAAYRNAHPDKAPLVFTEGEGYHGFCDEFDMLLGNELPLGVLLTDSTATVVNPFETEMIQQKWDLLNEYYEKGYINQDCTTLKAAPLVQFCRGGHGFPYADIVSWSNNYPAVAVQRYDSYFTSGSATGAASAVSVLSPYPQKCVEVLNLIDSDAYLRNLIAYGIENVHYEKTGLTTIRKLNNRWEVSQLCQGTYFNLYTVDPAPADLWSLMKKQSDEAKDSPILGFSFNPKPVAALVAQVKNVCATYWPLASSGAASREDIYDEMMSQLKKTGLDLIQAEAQRQIDAWKMAP